MGNGPSTPSTGPSPSLSRHPGPGYGDPRRPGFHPGVILDKYGTLQEVQQDLRNRGLESSNLVVAIDFTKVSTQRSWCGEPAYAVRGSARGSSICMCSGHGHATWSQTHSSSILCRAMNGLARTLLVAGTCIHCMGRSKTLTSASSASLQRYLSTQ